MRKKKRISKNTDSYRKMATGSLKGKARRLAKTISAKSMIDEQTLYNSILELGVEFYCEGWLQMGHEKKAFKDKHAKSMKKEWDQFITEVDDLVNQNK